MSPIADCSCAVWKMYERMALSYNAVTQSYGGQMDRHCQSSTAQLSCTHVNGERERARLKYLRHHRSERFVLFK